MPKHAIRSSLTRAAAIGATAIGLFSAAYAQDTAPVQHTAATQTSVKPDAETLGFAAAILLIHHARLEAELKGAGQIALTAEVKAMASSEPVASALRDEQLAFATHRDTLASQMQGLAEAQTLARREAEILEKKNVNMKRQVAQVQRQLDQIIPLVNRGTLSVPQRLAIEQTLMQLETAQLDIELAILRAQQQENAVKRAISDLTRQSRSETLANLGQTRSQLSALSRQIEGVTQN